MKRLIALSLAVVMMLALAACGDKSETFDPKNLDFSSVADVEIPEGKVLPDDAVLKITVASHSSWPYDANWAVWKLIRENVGGELQINAIPSNDFATKFPLMMSDQEGMPDIFGFQGKPAGFSDYCEQGAFISLDACDELMPNYKAFWASLPEDQQQYRDIRKSADGKVYYAPNYGLERYTNIRCWLYREDIFAKHNLKTPTTTDELYNVCKKLKAIYPDSYPLCMRSGRNNINVIGSTWKPNFRYSAYYDFENEKWCYGAREPEMRQIVEFLNKMVTDGLMPPDFITIQTSDWEELVANSRGFILPAEYQIRIDHFNLPARAANPEFKLNAMQPPHANNGVGLPVVNKYNNDPGGMAICNTNDIERIANSARYIDWFYSDEGCEAVSWGKEGETFTEDENGNRKYILEENETAQFKYGFKTTGAALRIDPECIDASISAEQAATTDFMLNECTYPYLDPTIYMEFSAEDAEKVSEYNTTLQTLVEENLQKFITGQRPMSEWDAFQEELSTLPIDDLLALYEKTHQSYK